jgi:hypothetical protein
VKRNRKNSFFFVSTPLYENVLRLYLFRWRYSAYIILPSDRHNPGKTIKPESSISFWIVNGRNSSQERDWWSKGQQFACSIQNYSYIPSFSFSQRCCGIRESPRAMSSQNSKMKHHVPALTKAAAECAYIFHFQALHLLASVPTNRLLSGLC